MKRLAPALLGLSLGCASFSLVGPSSRPSGPRVAPTDLEAAELLPRDLDLAVRVDVERLRAALGQELLQRLADAAKGEGDGGLVARALPNAKTIVLGMRLGDVGLGDRVLAMEGEFGIVDLLPAGWEKRESERLGTWVLEPAAPLEPPKQGGPRRPPAPRDAFVRAILSGNKTLALVSAAEVDPVSRLLRDGPDALEPRKTGRREPVARGVVSLDMRVRPLPPGLAKRFEKIANVVAGLERITATAEVVDRAIAIEAQLEGVDEAGAERGRKFLELVLGGLLEGKQKDALRSVKVERVGKTIHAKLVVAAEAVARAL